MENKEKEVIISVKNLTKDYGRNRGIFDISFDVYKGTVFGYCGTNGSGKTTTLRHIMGFLKPQKGSVTVKGMDAWKDADEIKKIVDISPQESAVALNLTVKENLIFFQEIYDKKDKEYLEFIINSLGLKEVMNRRAKTLSGGYQRRLSIAIGLVSKPEILFLDEPTLGLDVISRRELWKIIEYFKGKVTIILTSHYLEEIEALCDKVAIMSKGNVLCEGTVEEIKNIANEDSFEEAFVKIVGGQDEKDINIY